MWALMNLRGRLKQLRLMLSTAGSVVVIRVGASLLMLANYSLVALLLSPGELGILFLVMSFGQTLSAITTLGFPEALIKVAADSEVDPGISVMRSAKKAVLTIALVFGLTFIAATALPVDPLFEMFWQGASLSHAGIMVWGNMVGNCLTLLVSQLLLAAHCRKSAVLVFYAAGPLGLAFVLATANLLGVSLDLHQIIVALALSLSIVALFGASTLAFFIPARWWQGSSVSISHLFKLGLPMMGTRVGGMVDSWSPVWIAGMFLSSATAAAVGASTRLLIGLLSLAQVVSFVSRPMVATLVALGEKQTLRAYFRATATVLGCYMGLVSVASWLAGHSIMQLLFGSEYYGSGLILAILSIGYCAPCIFGNIDVSLMLGGQQKSVFWINSCSTAMLMAGMVVGIQVGGIHWGVAIFSVFSVGKFFILAAVARNVYGFWSIPTVSMRLLSRGLKVLTESRFHMSGGK